MASSPQDWIVAASCCEGPRPGVTFAEMPREHRREMLAGAFAAALSTAYFVTLGILLVRPIPSRSLAAPVPMPNPAPADVVSVEPNPIIALATPRRERLPRPLAAVRLTSVDALPVVDVHPASIAPEAERRPGLLGRIVHGVRRVVQPPRY